MWDYPRPPALQPDSRRVEVWFAGEKIADTVGAFRVLETSHPPTFYIPPRDVVTASLVPSGKRSFCEFKGEAVYFHVRVGEKTAESAAWTYPEPSPGFEAITGCLSFYPARMERCTVEGETVKPQPGGVYGGWITTDVTGPFKGGPGTEDW